jgi:hypothetical protein
MKIKELVRKCLDVQNYIQIKVKDVAFITVLSFTGVVIGS